MSLKRQMQTTFGGPDAPKAEVGNCWSTCIACLVGIEARRVPNFCADPGGDNGEWFIAAQRWLSARGLAMAEFTSNPETWGDCYEHAVCIASGMGPRGHLHSVLWQHGRLLHDPHPSGAGLVGPPTAFGVLVVLDLANAMRSFAPDVRFA